MFKRTLGAIVEDDGVFFRVWSTNADNVDLVLDGDNSRIMALKKKDGS